MLPPQYTSKPTGAPRLKFSKALPMAPGSVSRIVWSVLFCALCFTWGLSEALNLKLQDKIYAQLPSVELPRIDMPQIAMPNIDALTLPDFNELKMAAQANANSIQQVAETKPQAQKVIKLKSGETIITTANPTPFYAKASADIQPIGTIEQNSSLRISKSEEGWVAVKGGTKTFWIQQSNVRTSTP